MSRFVVWLLASTSFAALLGQFYGLWSMRAFAGIVVIPATVVLAGIAWHARRSPTGPANPSLWIVHGAIGGVAAAVIYDLFRLPFVLGGYPLFAVFPRFGQMLLNVPSQDVSWQVQVVGWAYHFSNGAALGIMFLAMVGIWNRLTLIGGAIAWAVTVEVLLLLTPYYAFFQLKLPWHVFLVLTFSAHLVFGVALGWWCWWRIGRRPAMVFT